MLNKNGCQKQGHVKGEIEGGKLGEWGVFKKGNLKNGTEISKRENYQ